MNEKHTIKQKDWWNYPLLKRWKTPFRHEDKYSKVLVKIGTQNGFGVAGYDYRIWNQGGGCNPGRKWGEYKSEKAAEIQTLEYLVGYIKNQFRRTKNLKPKCSKLIKAMESKIAGLRHGEQLELFF